MSESRPTSRYGEAEVRQLIENLKVMAAPSFVRAEHAITLLEAASALAALDQVRASRVNFDPETVKGMVIGGVEIISKPQWVENEWRALVNFHGALAVAVLSISIIGTPSTPGASAK